MEKSITWAFCRASRHQGLNVGLTKDAGNYTHWLYIALPDGADDAAKAQFKTITDEISTQHEYTAVERYQAPDAKATARHLFNI
tara:strand:+ start:2690 stop:2941 length:252 start_codon:yes stop_codon:yes gene_type:complete